MTVRIEALEERITMLESKIEGGNLVECVRSEVEKRIEEQNLSKPDERREEEWFNKIEDKFSRIMESHNKKRQEADSNYRV